MPQYRNIPFDSACYSEVANPGEQVLCVSVPELVGCGVSDMYLRKAFERQRTGGKSSVSCPLKPSDSAPLC